MQPDVRLWIPRAFLVCAASACQSEVSGDACPHVDHFRRSRAGDAVLDLASLLAVEDLDADGSPDLVAANPARDLLRITAIGNGPDPREISLAAGSFPADLAIADVDGDGCLDIVVANSRGGTVTVASCPHLAGPVWNFTTEPGAGAVEVADLDGDTSPEVLATAAFSGSLWINSVHGVTVEPWASLCLQPGRSILATGGGATVLVNTETSELSSIVATEIGEVRVRGATPTANFPVQALLIDGPREEPIVVVRGVFGELGLHTIGSNTYPQGFESLTGPSPWRSVVAADLNEDGQPELSALSENHGLFGVSERTIYQRLGEHLVPEGAAALVDLSRPSLPLLGAITDAGAMTLLVALPSRSFGSKESHTIAPGVVELIADLSGDAIDDILLVTPGASSALVLDGTALSAPPVPLPDLGVSPLGRFMVGHFDLDATLDLALYAQQDGAIYILRGDGDFVFTGVATTPAPFAPVSFAAAEFTGDTTSDILVTTAVSGAFLMVSRGDYTFDTRPVAGEGASGLIWTADLDGVAPTDVIFEATTPTPAYTVGRVLPGGSFIGGDRVELSFAASGTPPSVVDLNGDGHAEIVACGEETPDQPPGLILVQGDSWETAAFVPITNVVTSDAPPDVPPMSLDCNGVLTRSSALGSTISVYGVMEFSSGVRNPVILNFAALTGEEPIYTGSEVLRPEAASSVLLPRTTPAGIRLVAQFSSDTLVDFVGTAEIVLVPSQQILVMPGGFH